MVNRLKKAAFAVLHALTTKEARGPELALLRIIVAALGIKLGWNLAQK